MKVAILVLTWNACDAALACLQTVAQQQRPADTVLVVDNASEDGTAEQVARHYPDVLLIRNPHNLGFAAGMNVGIRALQQHDDPPDVVVLLNQDTLLTPTWLEEIVKPLADNPQAGAVGCKILYPDGRIQHAGAYLEWPRAVAHHIGWHEQDSGQHDEQRTLDVVTGAALALRMDALRQVGVFDTGYTPAYYEDADLCWRLRQQNYQVVYAPRAVLTHHESLSLRDEVRRGSYYNRGRLRYVLKSYALADMLGPFAEAELAFVRQHGHRMEERALRFAYIATIGNLPDILRARSAFHPPLTAAEQQAVAHMLLLCKHEVAQSAYRRGQSTLDAFYPL